MRIGGNIDIPCQDPQEWLALVKLLGYSAVLTPVDETADGEEKKEYLDLVSRHDLVIGEVGVWKNPISPDDATRRAAMEYACARLALADEIGARCAVNIAGSRGAVWDGCYADNYASDTYALIVDTVRAIIDRAAPRRTYYTLEPMPWMHPDSPDDYLRLIRDVDRKQFGVHLDYTNMINSVRLYLNSGDFIAECFHKLGPYIKSVHAKDVTMENGLPCRIREVPPGQGGIDFRRVLHLCEALGPDTTVFVEHLSGLEEYRDAAAFVRRTAVGEGIAVKTIE